MRAWTKVRGARYGCVVATSAPTLTLSMPLAEGLGSLAFGTQGGGWAWWTTTAMPAPDGVALRFDERGAEQGRPGRLEVVQVVVSATASGLTGEMLRAVPIARLEAVINTPRPAAKAREHIHHRRRRIDLSRLVPVEVRAIPVDFGDDEDDEPSDAELAEVRAALDAELDGVPLEEIDPRIEVPAGTRKPDGFYELVARAYLDQAARGRRPGAVIAEASGVPSTTVHRWVREARRRGLLAAGQRSGVRRPPRRGSP